MTDKINEVFDSYQEKQASNDDFDSYPRLEDVFENINEPNSRQSSNPSDDKESDNFIVPLSDTNPSPELFFWPENVENDSFDELPKIDNKDENNNEKKNNTNDEDQKDIINNEENNGDDNDNKNDVSNDNTAQLVELGKKRTKTDSSPGKYRPDLLRRKVKGLVLDNLLEFINEKICNLYDNKIGKGICIKQFQKLNKKILSSTIIKYNQEFLHKILEQIFSEMSGAKTNFPKEHNINLIKSLKNDNDYNKRNYFQNLFNLTFLQCLNHMNGTEWHQELLGLKKRSEILEKFSGDEDYKKNLETYFQKYESFINQTKGRRPRHEG